MPHARRVTTRLLFALAVSMGLLLPGCAVEEATAPNATLARGGNGGGGGGGGSGKPTVESTSPSNVAQGAQNIDVEVFGTGFISESEVEFELSGSATTAITTNSNTVNSDTHITANVTVEDDAAPVFYDVAVRNGPKKKGVGIELIKVDSNEPADPAIVFIVQGTVADLRVINASGAWEATVYQSQPGYGFFSNPTWSPDGSQIAFGLFELFVMDISIDPVTGAPVGGTPVEILDRDNNGTHPAWSPDGSRIAIGGFQADGSQAIRTVASDGSGTITVLYTADAAHRPLYPTWSPNGSQIAFAERLNSPSSGEDFEPVIKVISSTTGAVQATLLAGEFANIRELDWQRSAGGTLIAMAARHDGKRPRDREYAIYTASTTGGSPTQVADGESRAPAWSPDDSEIAYVGDSGKLEAVTLGTGVVRTLTPSNASQADWRR